MSLIDEALKKTQSALKKQNAREVFASESIIQAAQTTQPSSSKTTYPYQQKRFSRHSFKMPKIYQYGLMGVLATTTLLMIFFEIHAHSTAIEQRYTQFYKGVFSHFSSTQPVAKLTPLAKLPLTLNGIMKTKHKSAALINNQLYHVGETIDGYQIQQIHYDHVVLKDTISGKTEILKQDLA